MTGTTIDHLVAVTIFLAAILLFITLFNQTIQTAITYQQHRYLATKCSDTLDDILLSPGIPANWGQNSTNPTAFGLQDPEFTQYQLSPFSLMKLNSSVGTPVFYSGTGLYYSNTTIGLGQSLLVPYSQTIDSDTAASLMGINGSFGFSVTVTPVVNVSISEKQLNPLNVEVEIKVTGSGYPFADSKVTYCFIKNIGISSEYPSYTIECNATTTNNQGIASLNLTFDQTRESYALIAYARTSGLVGAGSYQHSRYNNYPVPLVSDFGSKRILVAHSRDIVNSSSPSQIAYNATFVILTQDFTLREMPLDNSTERTGKINPGTSRTMTIQANNTSSNPGILVMSYNSSDSSGIVLMPWGTNSIAFSTTFGDDPNNQNWVATDIRQVTIGNVAYQAKLLLWSLEGYLVMN